VTTRPAVAHHTTAASPVRVTVLTVIMVGLLTAGWFLSGRLVREVPPLTVAAVRTAATFAALTLVVLARPVTRAAAGTATGRARAVTLLAVFGFLFYYAGTMLGIARIGAVATGMVVGLLPCVTFLVGLATFGERLRAAKLAGVVLAVGASLAYGLRHGVPPGLAYAGEGAVVSGVALAFAGTVAYAVYGYAYRRWMGDLPAIASLPAITGVATVLLVALAALVPGGLRLPLDQLPALLLLGVVFTAPVFFVSHELVLLRGPLFTNSVAVCVPFLIRGTEWVLGSAPFFSLGELALFAVAATGVLITVRASQTSQTRKKEAS
jgi:drug/metabolite transporter (DMT)-like permease